MRVPFKYLGLEIGGNPRKKKFWEPIIVKLSTKLNTWKGRFLSMAGRICLIKSVFTSLPLYYFSFFKAPEAVCDSIVRIQRRFLWGWGRENRLISWVSWDNICRPLEEGGLEIKDVRKFNAALLAKWKWRLMSGEKGVWKYILLSKYGTKLNQRGRNQKKLSWWWCDLCKSCGEGEEVSWFHSEMGWKMGSGDKVRFWEDTWASSRALRDIYPRLYSISLNHRSKVAEVGEWEEEEWSWKLSWRRSRFQWESELLDELLRVIDRIKPRRDTTDIQTWGGDASGVYSVKTAYDCLAKSTRGRPNVIFKLLWQVKASPNVLVTAWRALLDRLPTKANLMTRGVMINSQPCVMCGGGIESAQHLFLDCTVAQRVWNRFLRWMGIAFVQHRELMYHFEQFHFPIFNHNQNLLWKGMWVAVVRCIWEQRNNIIFNQGVADDDEILHLAQTKAWLWLKHRLRCFNYSLAEWYMNPIHCIKS